MSSYHIIAASRQRCLDRGMDRELPPSPAIRLNPNQLSKEKTRYQSVLDVFALFSGKMMGLLEGEPHVIAVTNQDGFILECYGDPIMKDLLQELGFVAGICMDEEHMGTNSVFLSLYHDIPIQIVGNEHYHRIFEHTACYSVPFHFTEINLRGSATIMTTTSNHHQAYLALLTNMIDSVEREVSLRNINKNQILLQRLMANNVRNGLIITDRYGRITEFNAFVENITGYTRSQVIGSNVYAMEQVGRLLREVLIKTKHYENIELTFSSSLSKKTVCLFDAFPFYNDRNELMGAFAHFLDITERVELERQIITSEKFSAIGKLGAGLAHEIRNPLTSIMGFFKLIGQKKSPEKFEEYYDLIQTELFNMKRLVSDFVLMAKPGTPERKLCDVQELIRDIVRLMDSQAILKNTAITTEYVTGNIQVHIDPMQIKQALVNLIQNALEAINNGGSIHILTTFHDKLNTVGIAIEDNGVGLSEEELNQILNPFFTTKENGLGLGLSVCYRIIENHGGSIAVTSQKGVGTRFEVTLPVK